MWWTERKGAFPLLSRMALDYLVIPGEFSRDFCEQFLLYSYYNS